MTTFLYFVTDRTYGGRDYIQVDTHNELYIRGNTRSHIGYLPSHRVEVELKNKKELKNLMIQLDNVAHYFDATDKHNNYEL